MRPIVCLFLIGLAIRCYEANDGGMVCKGVLKDLALFLLGKLKTKLEIYNVTPVAVEASLEVKRCVDQMSYEDRFIVSERLVCKEFSKCGYLRQYP
uniref:Uncharacterized protein n=1 Tax=Mus spicilegus TaxID=10103 RepID=A0A8C6HQD0_MUSSI